MSWRPPWLEHDSTVSALFESQRHFEKLIGRSSLHDELQRYAESAHQAAEAFRQPYRDMLESTRGVFGRLVDLQSQPDFLQRLSLDLHPAWQLRLDRLAGTDRVGGLERILGTHAVAVNEMSTAAAVLFDRSDATRLRETLGAAAETQRLIAESITRLTSDYASLVRTADDLGDLTRLPPFVMEAASIELFRAGELLYSVAAAQPIPEESEETVDDARASVGELTPLEDLLREADPNFLVPLQGARESLSSSNPDRVRHVAISYRELYTHVTHRLAPAEDVKAWSQDPKLYDAKGKPTRRARLEFVRQGIGGSAFQTFLESDVDDVLRFLDAFLQSGTHELAPSISSDQLQKQADRMEGYIRLIVETWRNGRN